MGVAVGQRLSDQGIGVTVVDPVWALPVNPALVQLAGEHELVISIEDNGVVGGCGSRLAQEMRLADVWTPLREFGVAQEFLDHGSRSQLLEELGLTPQHIARYAVEAIVRNEESLDPSEVKRG
jgi:1-deoxy-D-xylulose-5-phosphate synthase